MRCERSASERSTCHRGTRRRRWARPVDAEFAEMRGKLDQTAAGMAQIVELLTRREDQ
jgi:hypothetical protein